MIDYHVHTSRCGHAKGDMRDYLKRAQELSLDEIGFADHLPLLTKQDPSLTMSIDQLDDYVQSIELLKKDFPGIDIKTGIEADYLPGLEEETARLLNTYDFDFVIGSVHFINGWGFDDSRYIEGYKDRDIYELYAHYFRLVKAAAESGLFDIIGHIDLIKKYNFRPEKSIEPLLEETISAIKDTGMCIELNTAGLRKPVGEIYPSVEVLRICFDAGVPIIFGSDAHAPEQVGMDFDQALSCAKQVGYRQYVTFRGRIPSYKAMF